MVSNVKTNKTTTKKQQKNPKQAQQPIRANTQNTSGHLEEKLRTVVAQVLQIKEWGGKLT